MDLWIGGNKLADGSNWTWCDDTRWEFTQWAPSKLRNSNSNILLIFIDIFDFPSIRLLAHCTSMNIGNSPKSMWTNVDCSEKKSFICQSDLIDRTISPLPSTTTQQLTTTRQPTTTCAPQWISSPQLSNCYRV